MLNHQAESAFERLSVDAERYVHATFGMPLHLTSHTPHDLPFYLGDRYWFWCGSLIGEPAVFMTPMQTTAGAVSELTKHRDLVRDRLNIRLVVVILRALPTSLRRRLIDSRIAFLVPGTQLYIPEALVDLRETSPSRIIEPRDRLSPTTQVVILAALLGHSVNDASLTALADRYQVAVMSMSRAFDELEAVGLAEPRKAGRQRRLKLNYHGHELWRAAEPRLQSPVRKVRLVRGHLPPEELPLAGESALAEMTMLEAPKVQRRAAPASVWKRMARHLELEPAWAYDETRSEVETWSYDPQTLSNDPRLVDPLSLYLSLRNANDERVDQAAEQLLESFQW